MSVSLAILSLLHQPAGRPNSATRLFRNSPVLGWTLRRLAACKSLSAITVLCWADQLAHVRQAAAAVEVVCIGERQPRPVMDLIAAARHWSEGWRGGLAGTCCHDLGFEPAAALGQAEARNADAVVLVDPDAGLVDPALIDSLVTHAQRTLEARYVFMPVAPGLSGLLLRTELLRHFADNGGFPGRSLAYWPDLPGRDPIANPECAPHPTPAARTLHRFVLDGQRQVERLSAATAALNGELASSDALTLVGRMDSAAIVDRLPREIVLELNTARATRAIFHPSTHLAISRPDLTVDLAAKVAAQAAAYDDTRFTLAGVGDSLLHPGFFEILDAIRSSGIQTVHVETDLAGLSPAAVEQLCATGVDLVSVHFPATSVGTYAAVMGVDALAPVMENMQRFAQARHGRFVPILVPLFAKCGQNLREMEAWYDYWLRTLGVATIIGPRDCAGQIPDASAVDMTPPRRVPCRRLQSRLTILSDGSAVPCEEDVLAREKCGHVATDPLAEIWTKRLASLRQSHQRSEYPALCGGCRQWHRP
ncbi:MAG: SPASM domain-containing protein [Tepidisphaeraceae bacterium]|jgi:radical SAM protein with 4Fe4S-binding SPASM domain